jgi:hypothetical protein
MLELAHSTGQVVPDALRWDAEQPGSRGSSLNLPRKQMKAAAKAEKCLILEP